MAIKLIDDKNIRDVADAIRAKNGTSLPLEFPDDFVDAIEDIETGGGATISPLSVTANGTYTAPTGTAYSPVTVNVSGGGSASVPAKEVNFRDYDGTVVNAYTAAEFLALESMPANPDHTSDGLTAQGWNWSFADAQSYVQSYGRLEVGQMYVPTDGKTHLFIHIPEDTPVGRRDFQVCWTQTVSEGVTIDWGDGSEPETFTGTSAANHAHTYADPGDYEITLEVTSGTISFVGSNTTAIYGPYDNPHAYYRERIVKAQIGNNVTSVGSYAFQACYVLASITMPSSVTSINTYAFENCYVLTSITIPNRVTIVNNYVFAYCYALGSVSIPSGTIRIGEYAFRACYILANVTIPMAVTSIDQYAFESCFSIASVTIPNMVTSIGKYAFNACRTLTSIVIPDSVTSIGSYAFQHNYYLKSITIPNRVTIVNNYVFAYCYALTSITIPSSVTSILTNAFQNCYSLTSITIPSSVTSISGNAFNTCAGILDYHFTSATPPSLSSTTAFSGIASDCIMYVPYSEDHSILEAYQSATNWSTYASHMQEEPQS